MALWNSNSGSTRRFKRSFSAARLCSRAGNRCGASSSIAQRLVCHSVQPALGWLCHFLGIACERSLRFRQSPKRASIPRYGALRHTLHRHRPIHDLGTVPVHSMRKRWSFVLRSHVTRSRFGCDLWIHPKSGQRPSPYSKQCFANDCVKDGFGTLEFSPEHERSNSFWNSRRGRGGPQLDIDLCTVSFLRRSRCKERVRSDPSRT